MEENSPFLRGKLLVARQLKENLRHLERFACARDEFIPDNPPARILKAALRLCGDQSFSSALAQAARTLLADFDDVGELSSLDANPPAAPLERQHQRFGPLLEMASLILESESPSAESGGERTFALMFEMSSVFEAFIAAELRRALWPGHQVTAQLRQRWLLERASGSTWRSAFQLRPDIAVRSEGRLTCLLDTKWKRLDEGESYSNVSSADIYQMHAYGTEYGAPTTILVYPRTAGFGLVVDDYRRPLRPEGLQRHTDTILVRTVDVSSDLSITGVRMKLRADLRSLVGESQ